MQMPKVPCMGIAYCSWSKLCQWVLETDRPGLLPYCLQKLLAKLFLRQRKKPRDGKQTRFALDTHNQNFYHVPTAKIDLALSASAGVRQELFMQSD